HAKRRDHLARRLIELHRLSKKLPILPRIKRHQTIKTEEQAKLHLQLFAHILFGTAKRLLCIAPPVPVSGSDDRADARDSHRLSGNADRVINQADVTDRIIVNLKDEVQLFRSPGIFVIFHAEDIFTPAEKPLALCVSEVFNEPYVFAHLFSFTIRSINFASSGNSPTLARRGVNVAQFLSIAKTLRKS